VLHRLDFGSSVAGVTLAIVEWRGESVQAAYGMPRMSAVRRRRGGRDFQVLGHVARKGAAQPAPSA
jgi:hypothetical protein